MRNTLFLIVTIAWAPRALLAQVVPSPLQNVLYRHTLSLNGEWHVIIDPHDTGSGTSRNRYYQNARPAGSTGVVEYDFAASPTLHVPGDWNSQRPELLFYEGTVWYERSFVYHPVGLVSDTGDRKKAFYVLQQFYREIGSASVAAGK